MRYRLKKKLWSTRLRYEILAPDETPLFEVVGKLLALRTTLTFSSAVGDEIARIQQRLLALRSTYVLHRDGEPEVRIRRMLRPLFKPRYEIEVPGAEPIVCLGNFWEQEFTFERGGRGIGTVSKKLFSWADSYGVDLEDDEDQVLLLAATIVVDLVAGESSGSGVE